MAQNSYFKNATIPFTWKSCWLKLKTSICINYITTIPTIFREFEGLIVLGTNQKQWESSLKKLQPKIQNLPFVDFNVAPWAQQSTCMQGIVGLGPIQRRQRMGEQTNMQVKWLYKHYTLGQMEEEPRAPDSLSTRLYLPTISHLVNSPRIWVNRTSNNYYLPLTTPYLLIQQIRMTKHPWKDLNFFHTLKQQDVAQTT